MKRGILDFFLENFGFLNGGKLDMTMTKISKSFKDKGKIQMGFVVNITERDPSSYLDRSAGCLLDAPEEENKFFPIKFDENGTTWTYSYEVLGEEKEGLYNIFFITCAEPDVSYSFELKLYLYNVHNGVKQYLSAGKAPLPSMYSFFSVVWFAFLIVWYMKFIRTGGSNVNRIHHLMTILIAIKGLALLFKAAELFYINQNGVAGGWAVPYYIFAGLKGVFMFCIIALIGSGWSFVKPFLSENEKKIFMIVIPLQVLDNIALIIIGDAAPGSTSFLTWTDIFRLVDIICCGAILIPIIWSMKHLREAQGTDGKAARSFEKLKLFRQFYLMVVSYIYFTRIIVYLLHSTLLFEWIWLGSFFSESATFAFFSVTGYKFRPVEENPYFHLDEEGNPDQEMQSIDTQEVSNRGTSDGSRREEE